MYKCCNITSNFRGTDPLPGVCPDLLAQHQVAHSHAETDLRSFKTKSAVIGDIH